MFYEEGDEHLGSTVTTYAKGIHSHIHCIAKPKNKAGELDLPPLPR